MCALWQRFIITFFMPNVHFHRFESAADEEYGKNLLG